MGYTVSGIDWQTRYNVVAMGTLAFMHKYMMILKKSFA